ncbi:hypothetical protein LDENG_00250160 [Lucifuga dentata]|nr:hypothetical protein LDENG_00250160 [Lucifuga dentata]
METGVAVGAEGGGPREPTLTDLAGILQAYMGQQEIREARLKEDAARQEQCFKALQHQFQLLQMEVQARTSPVAAPSLVQPGPDSDDDSQQAQASFPQQTI